jgi:hypothetical protein
VSRPCYDFITPQDAAGATYTCGWSEGVLRYVALDSFDWPAPMNDTTGYVSPGAYVTNDSPVRSRG